jgi:hypothetical protein
MEAMPEFEIVSLDEATLRTVSPRQGQYLKEYVSYIHQLPQGQAGKLHLLEEENPNTIRRRLAIAAQAVGIPLIIKRSGQDLYFWAEPPIAEEKPQRRRGRRPRAPEEPVPLEQPVREPEFPPTDTAPDLVAGREPER